jgi:hypothetical protein
MSIWGSTLFLKCHSKTWYTLFHFVCSPYLAVNIGLQFFRSDLVTMTTGSRIQTQDWKHPKYSLLSVAIYSRYIMLGATELGRAHCTVHVIVRENVGACSISWVIVRGTPSIYTVALARRLPFWPYISSLSAGRFKRHAYLYPPGLLTLPQESASRTANIHIPLSLHRIVL